MASKMSGKAIIASVMREIGASKRLKNPLVKPITIPIEEEMIAAEHVANDEMVCDIDDSKNPDSGQLDDALNPTIEGIPSEITVVEVIDKNDADDSESLNPEEITDELTDSTRQAKLFEDKEWSGEE